MGDHQPLRPLVWCSDPLGAKVGQEADRASHQPDPQVGLGLGMGGHPQEGWGEWRAGLQVCRSLELCPWALPSPVCKQPQLGRWGKLSCSALVYKGSHWLS